MSSAPRVVILEKQGRFLSWCEDLADGFRARGAETTTIQLRPSTWEEYRVKLQRKLPALENPAIIARVASALRAARPDLVVFLKQPGLPSAALDVWRSAIPQVPFVAWICDHVESWPENLVPGFDGIYYFDSASRELLETAHRMHGNGRRPRVFHLPLAVNPARYPAREIPFHHRHPTLVFAGKNSANRKAAFEAYRSHGGRIETYGPLADVGWRVWRKRHLSANQLAELYARHFAVFNLLQTPNTVHGVNLRAFEVPSAGGLGTYPMVPDLAHTFVPGEEIIAYRDLTDLKMQIDRLLTAPQRAAAIAAAGRARVLREHTFAHRAERFLADWLR